MFAWLHELAGQLQHPAILHDRNREQVFFSHPPIMYSVPACTTLKLYPGFPHGMLTTYSETINPDLLAFVKE